MTVIVELEVIKCRKWIKEVKNTERKKNCDCQCKEQ